MYLCIRACVCVHVCRRVCACVSTCVCVHSACVCMRVLRVLYCSHTLRSCMRSMGMTPAVTSDPVQLLRLAADEEEMMEIKVLALMPEWERFERSGALPSGSARVLAQLHQVSDPKAIRILFTTYDLGAMIPKVLTNVASEIQPSQYLLTLLSETCRSDSTMWDQVLKSSAEFYASISILLGRPNIDAYTSDKAIHVLTSIMSRSSGFTVQQVKLVCTNLVAGQYKTSQFGVLDGFSNLLKCDALRGPFFEVFGTLERILSVSVESPPALYRALFCVWVASFSDEVLGRTFASKADAIVALLKSTFQECRVEKILRMALAVIVNLLASPLLAEAMVESGILLVIQPLEYEKWRDAELYDSIRNVAAKVANETIKHSNFERYQRELDSKTLKWGFIHSEKFWLENVGNFERESFAPVAALVSLLDSSDLVTQAVACHDLGEFARLHPTGKRVIAKLNGKSAVMALMSNANRHVSKEALLCTQKIMLNQWQKLGAPKLK